MFTQGDCSAYAYKIILLLFAENEPHPSFVLKMFRTDEYNYQLENEVKTLYILEENYPDIEGIPKDKKKYTIF